jgi:catechol 2,3-dioxygenase-like lactoylglutathione lyase family enzyme
MRFYAQAFGLEVLHQTGDMVFLRTPGRHECVTLRRDSGSRVGDAGGIDHFGFPLENPAELDAAIEEVLRAGGRLIHKGEIEGGVPTAFVADPDGYRIQL